MIHPPSKERIGGFVVAQGLGLVELMMALALGLGLGVVVIRQYLGTLYLQDLQTHFMETQRNAAYARHLLTQAIHDSFGHQCHGETYPGSVHAWVHKDVASLPANTAINALPGSGVLRLRSGPCDAALTDVFYLSRRAGHVDNPVAIFRRRQRADGSYANAEEIIEGVSGLEFEIIADISPVDLLAPAFAYFDHYISGDDVVMVRVTMRFESPQFLTNDRLAGDSPAFSFSVASRNRTW